MNRNDLISNYGLARLNSATKYPSIETVHALGERGVPIENEKNPFGSLDPNTDVFVTEKVDGTNTRVLCFPDGSYMIGSREEFLYASGDILHVPTMGIVEGIRNHAYRWPECMRNWFWTDFDDEIVVLYGEFYGNKIGRAASNYAKERNGFRVFDVATVDSCWLQKDVETLASMRENGKLLSFQSWYDTEKIATSLGERIVPSVRVVKASEIPGTIPEMREFVASYAVTQCELDSEPGKPEGFVMRTENRDLILKARNEDYRERRR